MMASRRDVWQTPLQDLDALLLRLSPLVRKVCEGYAIDEDHADDLVQECLIHIAVKLSRYREEDVGSVEAWAWKVTNNLCKSLKRAEPARDRWSQNDHGIPDPAPLPDELLERKCRSAVVRASVKKLPERERTAIELVYFGGLPYREAASRMGVGVKAVQASVYRGIHTLRGMRGLAAWNESFRKSDMSGMQRRDLPDGHHPVLALEPNPGARDRIRAGLCFGEIDRLLDGVCFATGWRDLQTLVSRMPGCPVIVDPECPGNRRSGIEELRAIRTRIPACPIIGYGNPQAAWFRTSFRSEIGFLGVLRRGIDDGPDAVRLALLRATDCEGTKRLLDRLRDRVPKAIHRFLYVVLRESLTRRSVTGLATTMGLTSRTLARMCQTQRLPTPKRLLSLGAIFHVERLACWSGRSRGSTALALGFSDAANYGHLVKRALGTTSTEVAQKGGPDHVAQLMLRELDRGLAA